MIIQDIQFDIDNQRTIQISNIKVSSASEFNQNILQKDFRI